VTGGGRGIGRAIALRLAHDGADVALTYTRDEGAATEVVAKIEGMGRRALAMKGAVQSTDDNKRLVESVMGRFGRLDILVHNAGIASRGRTVVETDPSEVEKLVAVHAVGPHNLSALAVPHMKSQTRGDIVFISSVAAQLLGANGAPYNMGKAAMEALALTLAKEVRGSGIRVNIVRPGLVDTDMGRRLAVATRGVSDIHELDDKMPFGRVCAPEDIAGAVAFFVSGNADYVSGQTMCVSGGQEW
jgi:NAD(P)-dependent dehydrogenase (short-subunit alcohol dehydrogenase family)